MNALLENKNRTEEDREILLSIVRDMAASTTGAESTKNWAQDALWFDIPAFASKGILPAIKMFDSVFSNFKSCKAAILESEILLSDTMGIVCTIQKIDLIFKNDVAKTLLARQTDCFRKLENHKWILVHQHASLPSTGEWDGKIVTA